MGIEGECSGLSEGHAQEGIRGQLVHPIADLDTSLNVSDVSYLAIYPLIDHKKKKQGQTMLLQTAVMRSYRCDVNNCSVVFRSRLPTCATSPNPFECQCWGLPLQRGGHERLPCTSLRSHLRRRDLTTFNEYWWEDEQQKNTKGTTQLSQVPQILLVFWFVKIWIIKNLDVWREDLMLCLSMAHLSKPINKLVSLLSLITLVPSLKRLEEIT